MNQEEKWDGQERRGIPIHVLEHIDKRLSDQYALVDRRLNTTETQIKTLSDSVHNWMVAAPDTILTQCEEIVDELVPESPDDPGETLRDRRRAHRHAHAAWIKKVIDENALYKNLRERVSAWVVTGLIAAMLGALIYAVQSYLGIKAK